MFDRDFDEFAALVDAAISLSPNWKPIPAAGKALFFRAMEAYSLEQVRAALTAHIRDPKAGMFQPTPAHLIGHINGLTGGDGRPGVEEAWAIALTSQDEADTVVWTAEAAEAFSICQPVLKGGDEVGARMAFKDAYNRLVAAARLAGKPAAWNVSMGWDMQRREMAIGRAHVAGLLSAPAVQALLPNYSTAPVGGPEPEGLTRLKGELAKLQSGWAANAERRAAEVAAEREAEAQRKREIAAQVEAYQANVIPFKAHA
jgi:hypothetical protein